MKADLDDLYRIRAFDGCIRSRYARNLTPGEEHELNRIFEYLSKKGSDPNVQDVYLKEPLSQRQILLILSSDCSELIEAMFQLLAMAGQRFTLEENNNYSWQLFFLFYCPQLLEVLRTQQGWMHRSDCTDQLREIRVFVKYYRRPKRQQRHKGYRDKGSLPDEQFKLRSECLTEYYAEQARLLCEHDRELQDAIQIMIGYLQ